jgi:MYXO-CTERM domain-containing protein
MRTFSCAVTTCLALGLSATAVAADPVTSKPDPVGANDYNAAHGVLYIPTEAIDLVPVDMCPIPQQGNDNPGLGCTDLVAEPTTLEPVANIDEIVEGVVTALAPYNVIVTTTRPAAYVPHQMIIPQDNDDPESTSETCVLAFPDCDGIDRGDVAVTIGGSANCMDPDPVMTVLIAFGRLSGLEGKDNPLDVMMFPPDFTMAVTEYVDECNIIVTPEDPDTMMPTPLACPASYHEASGMCDMDDNQNSHQELLAVYGPADPAIITDDTTPPTIADVTGLPEEGGTVPADSMVDFSATITDDSGYVAVRMTYESPALEEAFGAPGGIASKCTAGACGVEGAMRIEFANGADMPYPDQSMPFGFSELTELPGGEYTVTIEASDFLGNAAEPVVVHFTVEGGTVDDTGPDPDTGDDDADDDDADADADDDDADDDDGDTEDESDDDGGSNVTGDGGDDEGCSCTTSGNPSNAAFLLFGIAGLAMTRRRKSA